MATYDPGVKIRENLRYIIPSLIGVVGALVGLLFWATRLEPVLRQAINDFLRGQTLALVNDSNDEKLKVTLGKLDFSLGRGRVLVDSVSVVYDDSTAERVERLRAHAPQVLLSGISIPDILFRRRLVLSDVRITSPTLYRQESDLRPQPKEKKQAGPPAGPSPTHDPRAYTLDRLDSLLYSFVSDWLPEDLEKTRIAVVQVNGADIVVVSGPPGRQKRNSIEKLVVEIKGIGLDSSKHRVFRDAWISAPRFRIATSEEADLVDAYGVALRAGATDTAVAIDSVAIVAGDYNILRVFGIERSWPKQTLTIERVALAPDISDAQFFRNIKRRATRVRLAINDISVSGMLSGSTIHQSTVARRLEVGRLEIDATTDKRYPPGTGRPPEMPVQAFARIPWIIAVDTVLVNGGSIKYTEIQPTGEPSRISFDKINAVVTGLVNKDPQGPIRIRANAALNNTGHLQAHFTMPVDTSRFIMEVNGTWTGMPLSNLNAFVVYSDGVRITQGVAGPTKFDFRIANGVARGTLSPTFKDLKVELVSKETGKANLGNKIKSFLAKTFVVRSHNTPEEKGYVSTYPINYRLTPRDTFFGVLWRSVRSAIIVAMKK